MAPLTAAEEHTLAQRVRDQLAPTPYAVSALAKLSGGTANFLYRGTLLQPLTGGSGTAEGTKTVVVKHSTDSVAINRDFPLDITRCDYEATMLHALDGFPRFVTTGSGCAVEVRVPQLYHFDRETHTQILQDFADTTDLTTMLQSPAAAVEKNLPGSGPKAVGHALGSWLREFHDWSSMPAQRPLQAQVGPNLGMRRLKCLITYDSFIEILERHPELLVEGCKDTLEEVQATMEQEFERPPAEGDESRGLIHGDFWSGNVLLPNSRWRDAQQSTQEEPNQLFIIDWENVQYGHRAVDIGGMLADLYERHHFSGASAGASASLPVLEGFVEGYGGPPLLKSNDDFAFRVAVHAGVHLICWYYRRDRNAPLPYPLPTVLAALTLGRDIILKGWREDKEGLKNTFLAPVFCEGQLGPREMGHQ
ncbi:hypothetical protein PG985_007233 [Apiospora marii]|uniref:Aminoglycoside phosphotransferase domain-containing protein n=1 Tax=Apiospora marii TaxID=335849 RepID=A0ABR1SFY6_9PEZI